MFRPVVIALVLLIGCVASPTAIGEPASRFENRSWTIESYHDGQSLAHWRDKFDHRGWIRFSDGMIEGASACGGFFGTYSLTGQSITIEAGVLLAGICLRRDGRQPVDTWPLNTPVLNALNRERFIEQRGEGLILRDRSGVTQVVLTPEQPLR